MLTHRTPRLSLIFARCKIVSTNSRFSSTYAPAAISTDHNWQPYSIHQSSRSDSSGNQNVRRMNMEPKRKAIGSHTAKRRKIDQPAPFLPEGSNDEVLAIEITELLSKASLDHQNGSSEHTSSTLETSQTDTAISSRSAAASYKLQEQVELDIVSLSSTGDGLAYSPSKDHIVVVPFSIPGDRVLAKIYKIFNRHSLADFIKVITPSSQREGVTPECKYFAKCSGCQFQMLPYETQLEHKRNIVQKAFRHFSGMREDQIPEVKPTMGSPLQYRYRTKLTPHFTRPFSRKWREWAEVPNIGFNIKGQREVMDIELCPIGTDIVQEGLKIERERVKDTIQTFKNGATILLRESTQRTYTPKLAPADTNGSEDSKSRTSPSSSIPSNPLDLDLQSSKLFHSPNTTITNTYPTHTDIKTYTSNEKSLATEYVTVTTDPTTNPPTTRTYEFTNTAGSFFQNNNAILGPFTSYIYSQCLPPPPSTSPEDNKINNGDQTNPQQQQNKPIKYLLDAYSGSGLFTLTLSPLFTSSLGIDIDPRSISAARSNASANYLSNTTGFMDADAAALFADVPYPPDQTLLVIDPPRKGCDRAFLKQLRLFGPKRVVYVSCNVHSQARDVGVLVNGFKVKMERGVRGMGGAMDGVEVDQDGNGDGFVVDEEWEGSSSAADLNRNGTTKKLWRYEIETLRGFDFFPQTGHVEGVCILNRVG